jgi:MFS family permease
MNPERKVVWLVSFSHFITHGFMTLLPAALVAIAIDQSMSFLQLGIIVNLGYFLYGLGALPAGYLADRIGSKKLLSIGVLGMAVSSMLVSISPSATYFAITYAMLGIFASIHHPAGLSLIARRVVANKGRAMGVHGVMGNLGLFLSPLLAALSILLFDSWRAAYLLYGILGILVFLLLHTARVAGEEDLTLKSGAGGLPKPLPGAVPADPGATPDQAGVKAAHPALIVFPLALLLLYVGSILSGFIFRGSLTFLPTLFQQEIAFIAHHDRPAVMAGYLTTAVLSLGLIGAWVGGYINDKIKHPEVVPIIIFLVATPALYYASRLTDHKLIAITALFSLIYYAWQPSQNYLIAKYTRKSSHGLGFGISFFLIFGMGSLATSAGGYWADGPGVDSFYGFMAMIGLVALVAATAVYFLRSYLINFHWKLEKEKQLPLPASNLNP